MTSRLSIIVALLICACSMNYAQKPCSITIIGHIKSGTPDFDQPYQVTLNNSTKTVSDQAGYFEIHDICPGTHSFLIKWGAFSEEWKGIEVKNDTTIHFKVDPEKLLSALNIKDASNGPNTFIKKRSLNEEDLISMGGGNLADLAANIPGVSGLKTGNTISKPVVGGMVGRRVVVYNNGVRLEGQDWGSEHGPEIDAQNINSITVIKGPGSLRYAPDALGGLILVESATPKKDPGIQGGINLTGVSNGRGGTSTGYVSGRLSKIPLGWRLQGTLKRLGNAQTPDYFLKNTGMQERNFSASLAYTKQRWEVNFHHSLFTSKVGIFSGAHIGNLTDLQNAFEADQPFDSTGFSYTIDRPYQDIIHELSKASLVFSINENNELEASYSRQYNGRQEYDKDLPLNDSLAALNLPDFSLEITTHSGELLWNHISSKKLSGSIGIVGKTQGNTHAYREFIPNFRNNAIGAFWLEQYTLEKLGLEAAVRYDHSFLNVYQRDQNNDIVINDHQYSGLSGSFGAAIMLSEKLLLNANIASGWRMPWVNELYSEGLHHGVAALEYGDQNLNIERSLGITLSPDYESDKFSLSIDVYGNLLNDYIFLRPADEPTLTIQGAFPTFHFEQTDTWSGGIDFATDYDISDHITIQGKGSIVRIQDRSSKEFLPGTPSDRFTLATIFKGKMKEIDWSLAPRLDHIAKQWRVIQEIDFVPPPEAYNLLGVTSSLKIPFKSQFVTMVFMVDNLLNINYRDYLNRFRFYAFDLGRNYTIKLNIPFNINQHEKNKP